MGIVENQPQTWDRCVYMLYGERQIDHILKIYSFLCANGTITVVICYSIYSRVSCQLRFVTFFAVQQMQTTNQR